MSRRAIQATSTQGSADWSSYVWWFMRRRMVQQEGASVDWEALHAAFMTWWRDPARWAEPAVTAPTAREFGLAMLGLCQRAGVPVTIAGTQVYCLGCRLALPGELTPSESPGEQGARQ